MVVVVGYLLLLVVESGRLAGSVMLAEWSWEGIRVGLDDDNHIHWGSVIVCWMLPLSRLYLIA